MSYHIPNTGHSGGQMPPASQHGTPGSHVDPSSSCHRSARKSKGHDPDSKVLHSRPTQTLGVTSDSLGGYSPSPAVSRQPRATQTPRTSSASTQTQRARKSSFARAESPVVASSAASGVRPESGSVRGNTGTQTVDVSVPGPVPHPVKPASASAYADPGLDGSYVAPSPSLAPHPDQPRRPASASLGPQETTGESSQLFDVSYRHANGSVLETPGRMSYADIAPLSAGKPSATHVHVHPPAYLPVTVDRAHADVSGHFCNIPEHRLLVSGFVVVFWSGWVCSQSASVEHAVDLL